MHASTPEPEHTARETALSQTEAAASRPRAAVWRDCLLTLSLAIVGGFLMDAINAPLPWTLGPITAVSLASLVLGRTFHWPLGIRNTALILLGYAMGRSFTIETGQAILSQLPLMLMATMITVLAGIFTAWLMFRHTAINFTSCLLGCVPGGLSQMVILADEIPDADLTAVTIMQTLRMLSVVFTIPFLATHVLPAGGAAAGSAVPVTASYETALLFATVAIVGAIIGRAIHLPTATMLGPLLATIVFILLSGESAPLVPVHAINVAQICVGSYIGCSINLRQLKDYRGMGPVLIGGVLLVLVVSMCMGLLISQLTGASLATTFLATAPGGLAEMGITALVVGADTSTMTAYQLTRLLFIMLIFPYIAKGIVALYQRRTA